MGGRAWVLGAVLLVQAGCQDAAIFACTSDDQCVQGSTQGFCEPTNYCSFPDGECPSGRRYGGLAGGGLAGQCVDADDAGTDTVAGTSTTGPPPMSTSTAPAESSSEGGTTLDPSESGPPPPECGNGVMEDGEACDDGNDEEGDGCNPDCVPSGSRLCVDVTDTGSGLDSAGRAVDAVGAGFVLVGYEWTENEGANLVARLYTDDCGVQWTTSVDIAGLNDVGYGVAAAGGDVWAVGYQSLGMGPQILIARIDIDGNLKETIDGALGIAYTVGLSADGLLVGGYVGELSTAFSSWVGVFDAEGAVIDEITSSAMDNDRVLGIAEGPEGIFVTGQRGASESQAELVLDRVDGGMGFVNIATIPPRSNRAEGQALARLMAGDLVVGGFVGTVGSPSPRDAVLARYTTDGTEVWVDVYGTADTGYSDEVEAVAIAPNGDIVMAGFVSGGGEAGNADRWVRRYTPDGEQRWEAVFAAEGGDVVRGVDVADDGKIFVVGEVTGDDASLDAWAAVLTP